MKGIASAPPADQTGVQQADGESADFAGSRGRAAADRGEGFPRAPYLAVDTLGGNLRLVAEDPAHLLLAFPGQQGLLEMVLEVRQDLLDPPGGESAGKGLPELLHKCLLIHATPILSPISG